MSIFAYPDPKIPLAERRIDSYLPLKGRFEKLFSALAEKEITTLGDLAQKLRGEDAQKKDSFMRNVEGLFLGNFQTIVAFEDGVPTYNSTFLSICKFLGMDPAEAYNPDVPIDRQHQQAAGMGQKVEALKT